MATRLQAFPRAPFVSAAIFEEPETSVAQDQKAASMRFPGNQLAVRKRGVRRFDLREPYFIAVSLSWPNFALLFSVLLALIHVLFTCLYLLRPAAIQGVGPGDYVHAFFFSVETLATAGYGELAPASLYGHIIASLEIQVGLVSTAILTGLLFVRFSRPQAKILFADSAVVPMHKNEKTLMVRIANGRLTMLTRANAELGLMLTQETEKGRTYRRSFELKLLRSKLPVFPLTWTLVHVIDEESPLHGLDSEALERADVRLILSIEAQDSALGVQVQTVHVYHHSKIKFGERYAGATAQASDETPIADLSRLSLTEADEGPSSGFEVI